MNGVREIPPDRWSLEGFYDPEPGISGRSVTKWGGFIDQIDHFDAGKYHPTTDSIHAGTGTALSIVANRISHRLDLQGPSVAVDTACSSSIVALDLACRSLWDGHCDLALSGGVNALLEPGGFLYFSAAGMMSTDGRVHAFDADGTGFVRAEGAGIVVLKTLAAAEAAGDRIYAVIRATAVNQDGSTPTLTGPSQAAQTAMLREVCAGRHPTRAGRLCRGARHRHAGR